METTLRSRLERALAKPLPDHPERVHIDVFNPWDDVIEGIYGSYSSESDKLMIAALEAVRDKETFSFIEKRGFVAEFALYVLAGHGMTEYGTSPRGGWPEPEIADLWENLISKWKAYAEVVWASPRSFP